ncbi:hypothetical protein [Daejeonella sp.]|jgi:hypothetical protein|uniref:hypothetical protein n=1 Tax=Daejeonella sp. TaxID=2805397 RepID=UPI0037C1369E
MIFFYLSLIVFLIFYLSGFFENYQNVDLGYSNKNSKTIIEFLTKHKSKTKIYSNAPQNYASFNNQKPIGKMLPDKVQFSYSFPLVKSHKVVFDCFLHPADVSSQVDLFGLSNSLIIKNKDGFKLRDGIHSDEFSLKMNQYCCFFKSFSDFGIDYKKLVFTYTSFTDKVSKFIYKELVSISQDNYFNRVQAALNFVQFLPYGLPEFDTNEWYYFGISTPPESFVLGYSDCDSKSIFFASILSQLIPAENIVLVSCTVNSGNESSNGEHMMAAVSDLGIEGESINFNGKKYLLLETTTPILIGQFDWTSFKANSIINLN